MKSYTKFGGIGIIRNGHIYLHIVCSASAFELGPTLHHIFNPTSFVMLHSSLNPY